MGWLSLLVLGFALIASLVTPLFVTSVSVAATDEEIAKCYSLLDGRSIREYDAVDGQIRRTIVSTNGNETGTLSEADFQTCLSASDKSCLATGVTPGLGYSESSITCTPSSNSSTFQTISDSARTCYDLLNAVAVTDRGAEGMFANNSGPDISDRISTCVANNYCVYTENNSSLFFRCVDPDTAISKATAESTAIARELEPILTLICGNPNSTVLQGDPTYVRCEAAVTSAFTACRLTTNYDGSELRTVRALPEVLSNCMINEQNLANSLPDGYTLRAELLAGAIESGQTRADAYREETSQDYLAAYCELNDGYTYDINDGSCNGPADAVAGGCPISDSDPLPWLGCAVFSALKNIAVGSDGHGGVVGILSDLLYADPRIMFSPEAADAMSTFRNIALILVVVTGLVMVISQSLGFEFLDAYTIRKTLPRLGFALVGISLAWPVLNLLVTFINDIGSLAYSVLVGLANVSQGNADFGQSIVSQITGITTVAGAGAAAVFILTWSGALALLASVVLGVLIGVLVLAVRQLVIFVVIIIAPLAIAAYVFPGGQKLWNFWKTTLLTTLFMYPIIMAFIGAGAALSYIIGSINDPTMQLMSLIIFFVPFFMLPWSFRLAGGLMTTIFSIANDRNKGAFDRLRNYRSNQTKQGWERKRDGNLFKGGTESNLRGRFNRGVASTINAPGAISSSGNLMRPHNWRAATRVANQSRDMSEIERNMKENQTYQSWIYDDDLNKLASGTNNASELRAALLATGQYNDTSKLNDTVARVETVRRSMGNEAFRSMTTRQSIAGGAAFKTSAKDKERGVTNAAGDVWAAVARASVDDDAMAQYLVANGRSEGSKAGRIDYAGAGFGTTLTQVNKMRKELKDTGTISQKTIDEASIAIHKDVYDSQGGAALVHSSMKPASVEEMIPTIRGTVTENLSKSDREATQGLASLAATYDGMQGSSPGKARLMADGVMGHKINIKDLSPGMKAKLQSALIQVGPDGEKSSRIDGTITYAQAIEALRGDQEFKEMRREYQNEISRVAGMPPVDPSADPRALS